MPVYEVRCTENRQTLTIDCQPGELGVRLARWQPMGGRFEIFKEHDGRRDLFLILTIRPPVDTM